MKRWLIFAALFLLYAIFLTYQITDPLWGINEDNAGLFGKAASHWLISGPAALNYLSHPPGIVLPLALSYKFLGRGEWQTRLPPILFSLASLVVFWLLVNSVFGSHQLAVLASLFYIFFPTSVYYGQLPSHEPFVRFFIIFSLWLLWLFQERKKIFYLIMLLLTVVLGGLVDWPYFFAVSAFALYVFLKRDFPRRRAVLLLLVLGGLVSSLLVLLQGFFSVGWSYPEVLFSFFSWRTGSPAFLKWLILKGAHETWMFTGIALTLALAGLLLYFTQENRDHKLFALTLLLPGLLHLVVFRGAALHHFYWSFYLTPPLALLAAWAWLKLDRRWAILLLSLFLTQSLWQSYSLFSRQYYEASDLALWVQLDDSLAREQPVCLGLNLAQHEIEFYLQRPAVFYPCLEAENFLFRIWQQELERGIGSYGLEAPFLVNIGSASLETALILELVKSAPPLKEKLLAYLTDNQKIRRQLLEYQELDASFIREQKLQMIECSYNFCFYKKNDSQPS